MTARKRVLALLLAAALGLVMLLSSLYIAENACHDCVGEGCQICQRLEACETVLQGGLAVLAALAAAAFAPVLCNFWAKRAAVLRGFDTPVILKVKLSN